MANIVGLPNRAGFSVCLPALGLLAGSLCATAAAGAECAALTVDHGLLSGVADHCPRKQVVDGLAALAGVRLGSVLPDGDSRLAMRLERATPEAAMAQALAGLSYVMLPDRSAKGAGKQLLLIIGAERIAAASQTMAQPGGAPDVDDASALADSAVNAFDAAERHAALEALTYADGSVNPALLQALRDRDVAVRMRALEMLRDVGGELPVDLLADLAGRDADHGIRLQALALLLDRAEGDPAADRVLRAALNGKDLRMRQLTRQLLRSRDPDVAGNVQTPTQ
ncbi:HEAT repeat domain-containing protein [Methylomonas sp. LL1]|uniref:HEAT repeat domain-containing protein n=1 Tax=Methylomonas sp. LL1 TaxID=2785785 RepID=UPI0018C43023|nr:HEAT repeat domain-containing protein [Methylomonas sp. LL1]QPK61797.1 HEAT repeat domain-containing protein [Methylomonas sp. LL1]